MGGHHERNPSQPTKQDSIVRQIRSLSIVRCPPTVLTLFLCVRNASALAPDDVLFLLLRKGVRKLTCRRCSLSLPFVLIPGTRTSTTAPSSHACRMLSGEGCCRQDQGAIKARGRHRHLIQFSKFSLSTHNSTPHTNVSQQELILRGFNFYSRLTFLAAPCTPRSLSTPPAWPPWPAPPRPSSAL